MFSCRRPRSRITRSDVTSRDLLLMRSTLLRKPLPENIAYDGVNFVNLAESASSFHRPDMVQIHYKTRPIIYAYFVHLFLIIFDNVVQEDVER